MAYSRDPKPTMGLHDDIFYTTVEVCVESYPRIKHFQSELQDLFPRFQRIYEQLPGSVKLSAESLGSIGDAVYQLVNSRPTLFLFGSTHSKLPTNDLMKKGKPYKTETHQFDEMHPLDENEKNYKLVVAICTLRMIDTKKKVKDFFGAENMMFLVDKTFGLNKDNVVNNLALLKELLNLKIEDKKVVYENKKGMISNSISIHWEHKFVNAFESLNMFLLEITKKRSRTCRCAFGDKRTGGRFYKEIKGFFEHPLTLLDVLLTSKGKPTENKLAIAIMCFARTVLIKEIARTYEMQDSKVFEYWQKEKYNEEYLQLLQEHLMTVPLVRKFYRVIKKPYDELAKCEVQKHYTLDDAKTIGKEVTKVLLGYFLQVGKNVKNIRINLNLLTVLRKELIRLLEETIDGGKYDEGIHKLDTWRGQIEGIKEVEAISLVFGNLIVLLKDPESADRESEVSRKIKRSLRCYPSEVIVQCGSHTYFAGRHGAGNNSEIVMGDAFLTGSGSRGTIGLFMHEDTSESRDLHFVTSSHAVLGSNVVKTNDQRPVLLGKTRHSLLTEDGLVDIAAIRIEEDMLNRCNVLFQDKHETYECKILDLDGISFLKEGKHIYKRGSSTGETKGCIISEDFGRAGLKEHNFLIGLPVGEDAATRNIGFAQEGDSGAVLYTKTPDGKNQYVAILMGRFDLRDEENDLNSTFKSLTKEMGSLIVTTFLREGLNRIEHKFKLKLTLPNPNEEILSC